jgi:hypothetical protein
VPSAGIGILREGHEAMAFAGITSVENPLEVNARTRCG